MERFNIRCPDHYPMKCHLSLADKSYLLTEEKYKAFFISQYKDQDEWLLSTLEKYFNDRTWRLLNAGKEGGTGTKFCNVCRYALASDFAIASLTPLNFNVFQEIGLMHGIQRQTLYLVNPTRLGSELKQIKLKTLPFDIDDQIYIEHTDAKSLIKALDREIPLILEKIQLLSGFENEKRLHIQKQLSELTPEAIKFLKVLILEGRRKFRGKSHNEIQTWSDKRGLTNESKKLQQEGFLVMSIESAGTRSVEHIQLHEDYRKILEDLLWNDFEVKDTAED